jgi:hypothetical protein
MWGLRAVEIDPNEGKGWDVLGMTERALPTPNHRKMLTYVLKGTALRGPDERHSIGWVLGYSSVELGRAALRRNVERLPLDLFSHMWLAFYDSLSGRKTEALEAAEAGLAIEPGFWGLLWPKASALADLDRPEEAAEIWDMDRTGLLADMVSFK